MLNRPVRNATPTARPPRMSGVALSSVLQIGENTPTTPCEASCGSKTAPRKSAPYPAAMAFQALPNVSPGAEKK